MPRKSQGLFKQSRHREPVRGAADERRLGAKEKAAGKDGVPVGEIKKERGDEKKGGEKKGFIGAV